MRRRARDRARSSLQQRAADVITGFAGSLAFVYLHLVLFGGWIVANLGWIPGVAAWDESFVILAMVASVEAIFLSTFVLITQNRMAADADRRADLDLQISLLTEHELTKLIRLTSTMADRLGIPIEEDHEIHEATRDIRPETVLDRLDRSAR